MRTELPSVDPLLDRVPTRAYNCRHFLREAWQHLTGEDLLERIPTLFKMEEIASLSAEDAKRVRQLDNPQTPCVVLMQNVGTQPHVGIYIDGEILHLASFGVQMAPVNIATNGFSRVRYYE